MRSQLKRLSNVPQPSSPVSFTPKQKDKETIRQLRQENSDLKHEIEAEKKKYDKSRTKTLELENSNLRHDLNVKNAEIRNLTSTVQELHRESKLNRDKLESTEQELKIAKEQLESVKNQLAEFSESEKEVE